MKTLLSFHNSQEIKDKYVNRLKEHRRLEHLTQGVGFKSNGTTKGCAVGCTLNNYNHQAYETELGLPEWLARLEDSIFENLSKEKAEQFAVDFLEVIPIGKDIQPILHKLAILRLERNLNRLETNKEPYANQCRDAIKLVINWHKSILINGSAARSAARSAAESATESATESAARSAAWSAAWSARSAARSAAWSAAESAARSTAWSAAWSAWSTAWSAAESAEYEWEADTLLKLLSEA